MEDFSQIATSKEDKSNGTDPTCKTTTWAFTTSSTLYDGGYDKPQNRLNAIEQAVDR